MVICNRAIKTEEKQACVSAQIMRVNTILRYSEAMEQRKIA